MKYKIGDRVRSKEKGEWNEGLEGTVFKREGTMYAVEFDGDLEDGWGREDEGDDGPCWWMVESDLSPVAERRDTFTVPPGYEAVRDTEGRATGELKLATRTFATGATRDTDEGKLDFEGFLSPLVLKAFAEYMHEKRKMPDGSMRNSDNWQLGIPVDQYMKSMWRHFFSVWESHRGNSGDVITELLALFFNVQGMLHEVLKGEKNV